MVIEYGNKFINSKRKIEEVARDICTERERKRQREQHDDMDLKEWQTEAMEMLEAQDDRKILFVVDIEGNQGKTYLSKYIVLMHDGVSFDNGKLADSTVMQVSRMCVLT